jgi:P27 family predicted phage terminase small subunit
VSRPKLTETEAFLRGTKSKAVAYESTFRTGRPKAPKHLSAEALVEFRRVSKILEQRKTETPGDAGVLALYSEIFSRWIAAKQTVAAEGLMLDVVVLDSNGTAHTSRKLHPLLKVIQACETRLLPLMKSLALTPIDREKAKALKPDEGKLPPAPGTIGWLLINGRRESPPENEIESEGEPTDAL